MTRLAREVNWLGQAAARADDQALVRVVQMLDALPDRGAVDQVLAQARQRLRALRPARPLGFTRLLFLPLNGALVPSTRWKRGEALVPRSSIAALTEPVQQQLGASATELLAACEGHTTADHALVARIGAELWPRAALALPATPPPGWAQTGLTLADYPGIAELCRPLWQHGLALWQAMAAAPEGPPPHLARAALVAVQPAGPRAFTAALAALMPLATQPGQLATLAAGLEPQCRAVAIQAVEQMLDEPMPALDLLDLGGATAATLALCARLDDLAQCSLVQGERQHRLAALRRAADEACRERFMAAAEAQVMLPLGKLRLAPQVADADVVALEAAARALHGLQAAGRKLGGGGAYDKALLTLSEAMAGLVAGPANPAGLRPIDLARLVEILRGPDVAAALLAERT